VLLLATAAVVLVSKKGRRFDLSILQRQRQVQLILLGLCLFCLKNAAAVGVNASSGNVDLPALRGAARRLDVVTSFEGLRAAVLAAPSDSTETVIEINANLTAASEYNAFSIVIVTSGQNVVIHGTNQSQRWFLDAAGNQSSPRRFFTVESGAKLELIDLRLMNGYVRVNNAACCSLSFIATSGLTHAVISCLCSHPCANDVWLWLLWCVWHTLILRSQEASDVAYSRCAAVVLLTLSPCLCLRAALSSRLAD